MEKQIQSTFKEAEERNKKKVLFLLQINILEAELDEYKIKGDRLVRESQDEHQQQLDYLRKNYEDDKKKLEARITDEKIKADRRYNDLLDEYE